jgi:5-methylcytosine-specific restriction endonuclease McrA
MKLFAQKRQSLSEKTRKQVYKKNNGLCYYCGCNPNKLFADHFIPSYLNGKDTLDNLVPACQRCNRLKSNLTIEDFRERYVRMEILQYPTFSYKQKSWMLSRGLDIDNEINITKSTFKFFFERGVL